MNPPRAKTNRLSQLLLALGLMGVTLAFYFRSLTGDFIWDDNTYISDNWVLRSLAGLRAIWEDPSATCQYYPLSFTFFWTIHHFFGLNPVAYHLVTVLLHGAAAVLLWQVLERLRMRGALLAGVIFALHPVNVMSVAWMTELKNTLSASLALGACWAYLRFAGLGVYGVKRARRECWGWYALALALFQLAMFAKTAVSFLPVTLFLIVWWQRERVTWRDALALVPMLGISIGMGLLTIYIERHAGGASGSDFTIPFLDRVLISGRSFWFYLGKLVWPDRLTFIYPRWKVDTGQWWQWLYPIATVAVLAGSWLARGRIGKGVFAAIMHFYISTSMLVLAVVLYMMQYSFVADHWAYFGSMSMIALAAAGIARAAEWAGRWGRPLELGAGIGLALLLGTRTSAQCAMYSNLETLWRTTLAGNPECWMAHNNLALYLLRQGRIDEAIQECDAALRLNPNDGEAWTNLGLAMLRLGRNGGAAIDFRSATQVDPNFAEAWSDLGLALANQGEIDEAIAQFRKAAQVGPAFAGARYNLGLALIRQGRIDEAIEQFRAALRIDPDYGDAEYDLGLALFQQGDAGDAISHMERALELEPANTSVQISLAWMLATAPKPALRDGKRAVELASDADRSSGGGDVGILRTLAAAYAQAGEYYDAVRATQAALQLAESGTNSDLEQKLETELKLYQAGQPYKDAR
jgi:tetratricopeptide (TPR) repeat protein